jgi:phosphatidylglycerol:prolipoprotein diacylglycerol transferase
MMNGLVHIWNHIPEHISPVIFQIGQFQIRYYGLMYILSFSVVYLLMLYRIGREPFHFTRDTVQDFIVWLILGLMLGARLGYVFIYNFRYYMDNPVEILLPFSLSGGFHFTGLAGMSYHGGLTGMVIVTIYFCRRKGISFWRITDLIIPAIPLAYTFGRIGNFINGELYGKVTSRSWGMYFPLDPTGQLRHPSQLYEAFFEGIFLFAVLWSIRKRTALKGHFLALYLMGYGLVRFFIEFVREPDPQIGYIAGFLTMGQVLCAMMMAGGAGLFLFRSRAYAS